MSCQKTRLQGRVVSGYATGNSKRWTFVRENRERHHLYLVQKKCDSKLKWIFQETRKNHHESCFMIFPYFSNVFPLGLRSRGWSRGNSFWITAFRTMRLGFLRRGDEGNRCFFFRGKWWLWIMVTDWLVVWNMAFMTFHSVGNGLIIPTDEHIFFRGVGIPPTSESWLPSGYD